MLHEGKSRADPKEKIFRFQSYSEYNINSNISSIFHSISLNRTFIYFDCKNMRYLKIKKINLQFYFDVNLVTFV